MYKVKNRILMLTLLCVGACSAGKPEPAKASSKYNFDYSITNQRKNNIIQIFDDGQTTYIQFFPQSLTKDSVSGLMEDGKRLSFSCVGKRLCRANKIFDDLTISELSADTKIIRLTPPKPEIPSHRGEDAN